MRILKKQLGRLLQQLISAGIFQPWLELCLKHIRKTRQGDKSAVNLLVLSSFRLKNDLDILKQDSSFTIYEIDIKWQDRISALFGDISQTKKRYGRLPVHMEKRMQQFVEKIVARKNIDVVLSANFWYLRDMPWGRAFHASGMPYLVLFRECLKTREPHQSWVQEQCRKIGEFYGSHIIVHNEKIKQVLIDSGFVDAKRVHALGCMRMDNYLEKVSEFNNTKRAAGKNQLVAFSFTTGIGLNDLGVLPFKQNLFLGWYRLFESFHCVVARLALNYPQTNFIIKTKWGGSWFTLINKALEDNGLNPRTISNLELSSTQNPHQLIFDSKVILGFSSSTLLEAAIANKPVIVPDYEECHKTKYKDRIQLLDLYDLFEVAATEDEFYQKSAFYIDNDFESSPALEEKRRHGFETWLSSTKANATERYTGFIKKQAGKA